MPPCRPPLEHALNSCHDLFSFQLLLSATTPFPELAGEESYSCVWTGLPVMVPLVQSGADMYCDFTACNITSEAQGRSEL